MGKRIWQKNNSKLAILDTPEGEKLSLEEFSKLVQADVNSQLTWIMVRSCKGISCKECYIKKQCVTRKTSDSQALAGEIIKAAVDKEKKND